MWRIFAIPAGASFRGAGSVELVCAAETVGNRTTQAAATSKPLRSIDCMMDLSLGKPLPWITCINSDAAESKGKVTGQKVSRGDTAAVQGKNLDAKQPVI